MPVERSEAYRKVSNLLPELSRGELEQVRAAAGALLHLGPGTPDLPGKPTDEASWVLEAIARTLERKGVEFAHAGWLRKSPAFPSFEKYKLPSILHYLESATTRTKKAHNRALKTAILCMGVDLLYINLERSGFPITARTIISHSHRIPAMLNAAFPGYAANGLLGMVIKLEKADVRTKRSDGAVPRDERGTDARHRPNGRT